MPQGDRRRGVCRRREIDLQPQEVNLQPQDVRRARGAGHGHVHVRWLIGRARGWEHPSCPCAAIQAGAPGHAGCRDRGGLSSSGIAPSGPTRRPFGVKGRRAGPKGAHHVFCFRPPRRHPAWRPGAGFRCRAAVRRAAPGRLSGRAGVPDAVRDAASRPRAGGPPRPARPGQCLDRALHRGGRRPLLAVQARLDAGFAPRTLAEVWSDRANYPLSGSIVRYIDRRYAAQRSGTCLGRDPTGHDPLAARRRRSSELLTAWRGVEAAAGPERTTARALPEPLPRQTGTSRGTGA